MRKASPSAATVRSASACLGTLAAGALESSNVNVVEQMVDMIQTQRTYEMNSKAVSAADSMLQFLTNKL